MQGNRVGPRLTAIVIIVSALLAMPARAETVTWYGRENGTHTASGQRFRPEGRTCAHRDYPFGTVLRVTWHGRSVDCRVNDFGPAKWTGVDLDLAKGAARQLGMIDAGRISADIVVVKMGRME
jgi:rare lipoprotein A